MDDHKGGSAVLDDAVDDGNALNSGHSLAA